MRRKEIRSQSKPNQIYSLLETEDGWFCPCSGAYYTNKCKHLMQAITEDGGKYPTCFHYWHQIEDNPQKRNEFMCEGCGKTMRIVREERGEDVVIKVEVE